MDMGQPGTVDITGQGPATQAVDASKGITFCITITNGQVTMEKYAAGGQPSGDAQPMDLRAALAEVMDAAESSMPTEEEAGFDDGFGPVKKRAKPGAHPFGKPEE